MTYFALAVLSERGIACSQFVGSIKCRIFVSGWIILKSAVQQSYMYDTTCLLQVNFLQEDSPLSLSSLSALDGVKQEVNIVKIATAKLLPQFPGNI